jgi:hypothetical protein
VLGLPRGGVPVAAEVARALGAPMDVLVVRKIGVPGHAELAMGAVASGGVRVLNDAIIDGSVKNFATQELAEDALRGENFQCISEDDDGSVWITHEGRVAYIQKVLPLDQVEVGYYYTEARS